MTPHAASALLALARVCHSHLETLLGEAVQQAGGGLPGLLAAQAEYRALYELRDALAAAIAEAEAS